MFRIPSVKPTLSTKLQEIFLPIFCFNCILGCVARIREFLNPQRGTTVYRVQIRLFGSSVLIPEGVSSNGNDIEMKRNDTSIIGVFSGSKRNEPTYSRTWKDRSEANTIIIIVCRIEEKTNIISLRSCSIEAKRTNLIKIYAGSNNNVLGWSKTLQDRSKANVIGPFTNKIEEKTKFSS